MKRTLTIIGYCFLIFMSGIVFTVNLSNLIPTNPVYEAAWYKVGLSLMTALMFTVFVIRRDENEI